MKLTAAQAQHVADQLDGQTIPDEHPNASQLRDAIGDHTFFLNSEGLHIVEPAEGEDGSDTSAVRIASWSAEQEGHLFLHAPELAGPVSIEPESGEAH